MNGSGKKDFTAEGAEIAEIRYRISADSAVNRGFTQLKTAIRNDSLTAYLTAPRAR